MRGVRPVIASRRVLGYGDVAARVRLPPSVTLFALSTGHMATNHP